MMSKDKQNVGEDEKIDLNFFDSPPKNEEITPLKPLKAVIAELGHEEHSTIKPLQVP